MRRLASISAPGVSYLARTAEGVVASAIDRIWAIRAHRCPTAIEGWVADASVQIYFNLGSGGRDLWDPREEPSNRAAWVLGPHTEPLQIAKETEGSDIVAARLAPAATRCILGVPAAELRSQVVDLDRLWPTGVERLRDRLGRAEMLVSRLDILERALYERWMSQCDVEDQLASELCRRLSEPGVRRIRDLAGELGVPHRRIIRLFVDRVGLKPKEFQRVRRFHRLLDGVDLERPRWSAHAYSSGFADQSHMIREFRRLAGVTPLQYLESKSPIGRECVRLAMAPWATTERSTTPA